MGFGPPGAQFDMAYPKVSLHNSTSVQLDADEAWTGNWEECTMYSSICVSVDSDVSSATGGFVVEFSDDGQNVRSSTPLSVNILIAQGCTHVYKPVFKFYRVTYTNGSSATSSFVIQTLLHTEAAPLVTAHANERIGGNSDVNLVRVANSARLDMARGRHYDVKVVHKFGANLDISTAASEDIWIGGGTKVWPTTAETVRVRAGGNAADTDGGSGAQTIIVEGLDENGNEASETITLAGASASSATTTTFTRINRVYCGAVGTYHGNNTGVIIVENTSSSQIMGYIAAGEGQTEQSHYTVPLGFTAYIDNAVVCVDANGTKSASVRFFNSRNALDFTTPYGAKRIFVRGTGLQGTNNFNIDTPIQLPALTDIWVDATVSANNTAVSVFYDLYLTKNDSDYDPQ